MTDIAHAPATGTPVAESRPPIEVVRDSPTRAVAVAEKRAGREPNVWRTASLGGVIGFVAATIGVTVAGLIGGIGTGNAVGLGLFVGMWGGLGFGFMLGATVPLGRYQEAAEAAARLQHH